MTEMVLLAGKDGSKVATVACPQCGRISRQILKAESQSQPRSELSSIHACPTCGAKYNAAAVSSGTAWLAAYSRYTSQGEQSYNNAVKDAYQSAKVDATKDAAVTEKIVICGVTFRYNDHQYTYILSDPDIKVGDRVIVPVGNSNAEKEAVVKTIGYYLPSDAPCPYKCVLRKADSKTKHTSSANTRPLKVISNYSDDKEPESKKAITENLLSQASYDNIESAVPIPESVPVSERSHANTDILDRKVETWKKQLLDLSKRNKMINYRETKRSSLKILEPGFEELFNRLAVSEEELTFQRPIDKDSDIRTFSMISLLETLAYPIPVHVGDIKTAGSLLERRIALSNLRSKSKLARDEQGTNILYLCFGFIEWRENNSSNAPWLKSPLLMMPVSLKLESVRAPFIISRYDDDIEVNPTLDYLFNERYGIDLPTFELSGEESLEQYMQAIEEITDRQGWKLTREVNLGLLSFLKISMYHDLDKSYRRMQENPVIRAMTGGAGDDVKIPDEYLNLEIDAASPYDCYQVVNSDSSQQEAIMLSKAGVSFVMQGPPGTGKSQTITNIIAEALADGKKVLFVSEKAAALQVVYKRLCETGLNDFCLALHSHKANKKEILDNIAANLKLPSKRIKDGVMSELNELFHDRKALNQYVRELHEEILPLEKSLYKAFGELSSMRDVPYVSVAVEAPEKISSSDYNAMLYRVSGYAKSLDSLGCKFSENPWNKTVIKSIDENLKNNLNNNISGLDAKINTLNLELNRLHESFRLAGDLSWDYVRRLSSMLGLFDKLPLFPQSWIDENIRTQILAAAKERGSLSSKYRDEYLAACEIFKESVFEFDIDGLAASISKALSLIRETENYSGISDAEFLKNAPKLLEESSLVIDEYNTLSSAYEKLRKIIGVNLPCTVKNAGSLNKICGLLISAPLIKREFCNKDRLEYAKSQLTMAQSHSSRLLDARAKVLSSYKQDVLSIDTKTYEVRFSYQYDNAFRILVYQYEKDFSLLQGLRKSAAAFETRDIIVLFESIAEVNRLKGELELSDYELRLHFADEYAGIETQWYALDRIFIQIRGQIEKACDVSGEIRKSMEVILSEWDSDVLKIDASAMLVRFRTQYTGVLKIMKTSYRNDMTLIKGFHKEFGAKLSDADAVSLLQNLKAILEKKDELAQCAKNISKHFPQESEAYQVNWDLVRTDFERLVKEKEKVSSLTNEIIEAQEAVAKAWNKDAFSIEPSLAEKILLRFKNSYTDSFHELMRQYNEDLRRLSAMSLGTTSITADAVFNLLESIKAINKELLWFGSEASENLRDTFGGEYSGYETDWGFIANKLDFIASFSDMFVDSVIPAQVVDMLSDSTMRGKLFPDIKELLKTMSAEKPDEINNRTLALIPATNSALVLEALLPTLHSLKLGFTILNDGIKALQNYALREASAGDLLAGTSRIRRAKSLYRELLSFADTDKALFEERYAGIDTEWNGIVTDAEKISTFIDACEAEPAIDGFLRLVCNDAEMRSKISNAKIKLDERIADIEPGLNAFSLFFEEGAQLSCIPLPELSLKVSSCANNIVILDNWLACQEAKADCDGIGLSGFTAEIEKHDNSIENIVDVFKRGFYTAWIQAVIDRKPAVAQFRRRVHDERIEHFAALDKKLLLVNRERVRQRVVDQIPDSNRILSANDELSILLHEIGKKRRTMPLRKLFKSIPTLLLKLKPCMMMSPLSVAYFLEAESYEFDTVIFDESSQIFPQDAIGAIFRGRQLIVAGDSKQLPPTNFFNTSTDNAEDYDTVNDDGYEDEIYDSILEETAGVLPNRTLLWHYRSKHESLIAFSNQEIYKNELITFPSSVERAADTGVEFVFVEGGVYEGKGRNTDEAIRCVTLVKEHFDNYPDRSLGIIAFSENQQKTILHDLQKFREQNTEYEKFFVEDKEDEFFVKNLENVQGDERDTIIFSIGYGKTKEQHDSNRVMSHNFGPLNKKGGERRLNVAITRAKLNVKLVASIIHTDIDLDRTDSDGVKTLRSYIEFASNGSVTLRDGRGSVENDDFVSAVAEVIESHGYSVKKNMGCSGYKIDIAVIHPEMENCFVAGVECDGYSYAMAKTARDRDHLRKSVLEAMGWNIYRCWSPVWNAASEVEGQRLLEFIGNAVNNYNAEADSPQTDDCDTVTDAEEFTEEVVEEPVDESQNISGSDDLNNPYGFDYYISATWYETPNISQYQGADKVAEEIKYIVGIEQPIFADLLYQRMAGAFGNQKATAPIRNSVDTVMRNSKLKGLVVKDKDGFITLSGFDGLKVRIPSPGSPIRQINYISPDEIGLAMITVASKAIGISAEDLIDATVRALGFARKGERMMSCMNKALDKLVRDGRVRIIDGKVSVTGGESRGQ